MTVINKKVMSKQSSPPCACLAGPSSLRRRQELQNPRCDCIVKDQFRSSCPSSWTRHTSQFTGQHFPCCQLFPTSQTLISAGVRATGPAFIPGPYLCFVNTHFPLQGCLQTRSSQLWLPGNPVHFLKALENTEA